MGNIDDVKHEAEKFEADKLEAAKLKLAYGIQNLFRGYAMRKDYEHLKSGNNHVKAFSEKASALIATGDLKAARDALDEAITVKEDLEKFRDEVAENPILVMGKLGIKF